MEVKKEFVLNKGSHENWGIRVRGGTDLPFPLTIVMIKINSLAYNSGLRAGDVITHVNGESMNNLTTNDASKKISDSGDHLEMSVKRLACDDE